MQIKTLVPVLACQELEKTLAFYQQALDCIILAQQQGPDGLGWVHLKASDVDLMLQEQDKNPLQRDMTDKNLFYYYTDDVETYYRFIKARGIQTSELQTTDYGMKEFFLVDPEGNRLAIGQSVK